MSDETKVQKPSLLGMIMSPTEQFERIKERPRIWGAMAIITVLFVIGTWLTSLNVEGEWLKGFTEDEVAVIESFAKAGAIVGGFIVPIFTVLISSFVYWIIAKVASSEVSFKQLFSMNTYIMIISALSIIVNGLLSKLIGSDPEKLSTSLGSIIDTTGAMGALINNIELFAIWGVIIAAIGLHKVASFSKGLAWTISIGFFVLSIIFAMIGAGISDVVGA